VRSKRFTAPAAMTMEKAVERYIRIKELAPAK
jgi:hypothetical protein